MAMVALEELAEHRGVLFELMRASFNDDA